MSVNKNFTVRHGLEVNENLIFANSDTSNVGFGSTNPEYRVDINGVLALNNELRVPPLSPFVKNVQGTVSSAEPLLITGINTTGININDRLNSGLVVPPNTRVKSIGVSSIVLENPHTNLSPTPVTTNFEITRRTSSGNANEVLISQGPNKAPLWVNADQAFGAGKGLNLNTSTTSTPYYPVFVPGVGSTELYINSSKFSVIPSTGSLGLGISSPDPNYRLDVSGDARISNDLDVTNIVTALDYFGRGINLTGIVTQIDSGIGIQFESTENPGKGVVTISSYTPVGKTIYVSQNGDDNNTGFAENYTKRTIKSAAAVAFPGDTIKVFPGFYLEENPIILNRNVAVEGTELRNCVISPKYLDKDLFYVNNSCHITDASFRGPNVNKGVSIVSLQPLTGVSSDRYFDAARMIRLNLDYIAKESVGFLTSGFSGFAGTHREQDAARLIDLNIDFIASEAVGFLTSTSYKNPAFVVPTGNPKDCSDDIKDILRSISYDLKAASNKKSIGAGLSYYSGNSLQHITGTDINGYSIKTATIDTIVKAIGIATHVINNIVYPKQFTSLNQNTSYSPIIVPGGCVTTSTKIQSLSGIVTGIINSGPSAAPTTIYGVNLESSDCADDIKDIWKCVIHDITRGGNSRCVAAGKSYFDSNFNLIPQILKNPGERTQTVATVDYSFNIARSIVNNCTWGGYPVGVGTTVVNAIYDNTTGITTITATNHNLQKNDAVRIVGLGFTCPSGPGTLTYPTGNLGFIFPVRNVINSNSFEVVVGQSTLPHTYVSGGTVQKYTNFQNEFTQVKDLAIQADPVTKFNDSINSCANVISAIRSCVGIVTSIVGLGSTAFAPSVGIRTTYPGNCGLGFTTILGVTNAVYDNESGNATLTIPGFRPTLYERIELRDLNFSCQSGLTTSTQKFPSGNYGYEFVITKVNQDNSFVINTGLSTIPHNYEGGGFVVNRSVAIQTATYNNNTGIVTITAPNARTRVGDTITLVGLGFTCPSGPTTLYYPSGKSGYQFIVNKVIGVGGTVFEVNVGTSTLPHTYVGGGVVKPAYSIGVGPITQGPYVRNCTNFIGDSIGMKVDGFAAEPGDKDDIGVTGTMSVDSYTQYNQGGIGVSITNGAYAQLVSIFTICDDIGIYTESGGQCDITNSNASFGNYGLYSKGVGDQKTKSIYRYTGVVSTTANIEQDQVVISGIGKYRPYDGQAVYFGELYYTIAGIAVTESGFGYSNAPSVTISAPTGPSGIVAEASSNIDISGGVTSVDIISSGNQYRLSEPPTITFSAPDSGIGVTAKGYAILAPIYYNIQSATLPSAGISTIVLTTNLNNTVGAGTTVYFTRLSLQLATSISLEYVGSGTNINLAKPALGGVSIQENEVVMIDGGKVVYTSTNQAGDFRIGDGIAINQLTGTISGRSFNQSILANVTPLIIALGG